MKKEKNTFKKTAALSIAIIIISLLTFKKVRALFPPPEITSDKLVGFSQYFGYPFYFDTLFFIFLVSIPIIVLTLRLLKNKFLK